MDDLWRVLVQFVFRVTFGVALAMALTPTRWVNCGFYRVHLWVLMGASLFAALIAYSQPVPPPSLFLPRQSLAALAIACCVASYVGSATWLYEAKRFGVAVLVFVTILGGAGALAVLKWELRSPLSNSLAVADAITSGLLLGSNLTAMLLGHWYLNSPGMRLEPLQRLIVMIGISLLMRSGVNGVGLLLESSHQSLGSTMWVFVLIRWLSGIVGTSVMGIMSWYTLKIPNTQSCTGILYAAVVVTFLGELTSQLMSAGTNFPL